MYETVFTIKSLTCPTMFVADCVRFVVSAIGRSSAANGSAKSIKMASPSADGSRIQATLRSCTTPSLAVEWPQLWATIDSPNRLQEDYVVWPKNQAIVSDCLWSRGDVRREPATFPVIDAKKSFSRVTVIQRLCAMVFRAP